MRTFATCSILLNLALLGALALSSNHRARDTVSQGLLPDLTNRPIRVREARTALPGAAISQTNRQAEMFHWSQVETRDFRQYVTNLQAIGCPRMTIHDIINAEVRALYDQKLRDLVAVEVQRFWDLVSNRKEMEEMVDRKYKELQGLSDERDEMLQALLGSDYEDSNITAESDRLEAVERRRADFDFLSENKTSVVLEIEDRANGLLAELTSQKDLLPAERQRRQQQIMQQKQVALEQALSGAELAEYKLRTSPAVQHLRELPGVAFSETELRTMVAAYDRHLPQERAAALEQNASVRASLLKQSQAAREAEMVQLLGPERFELYRRAGRQEFQNAFTFVERSGLPPGLADQLYQVHAATGDQIRQVQTNRALSLDERERQVAALRERAALSVTNLLGSAAAGYFEQNAGAWLR